MQHGYQCGMLWGASLAAGAQAYRLFGPSPQAEIRATIAAQNLVESFRARNHHINCFEITESRMQTAMETLRFFIKKGGPIKCFSMTASFAQQAFDEINSTFSGHHLEALSLPVSCATLLAQKMGALDYHQVMVAGFAGGIGLSGGACGALGAAIWIFSMNIIKQGNGKIDYKDPRAAQLIDRFLKCTNYEFECSTIVGRRFENVEDHASYLREGGCSEIIRLLAAH